MKKSEYSNHWKDPRWQKFRLKILEKDGFKCTQCGDDKSPLNAHHLYYISKRKPWEYPYSSVLTFCDDCHDENHEDPTQILEWETSFGVFTRAYHGDTIGYSIFGAYNETTAESVEEMADAVAWTLRKKGFMWKKLLTAYRKSKLWKPTKPNGGGTIE